MGVAHRCAILLVSVALVSACSPTHAPEDVSQNPRSAELVNAIRRLEKALSAHTEVLEHAMRDTETRSPVRPSGREGPATGAAHRTLGKFGDSIDELLATSKSIESLLRTTFEVMRTGPRSKGPPTNLQRMATAPSADLKKRFTTPEDGTRALMLMSYEDVLRVIGAPQTMSGNTVKWFYPHGFVDFVDGYVSRVHFSHKADWRNN